MIDAILEDPFSAGFSTALTLAFLWVLYIMATTEASESEKLQYRIEHYKPEEKKDGDCRD